MREGVALHDGHVMDAEDVAFLMSAERLPATLRLGGIALLTALLCGITLGSIVALNRQSAHDRLVMTFSVFFFAMQKFLFRLILILTGPLVFNTYLGGSAASGS